MRQWNEIEANFAQHYHLSLDDMLTMSWRRFRVLFSNLFSWNDEEGSKPDSISSSVDWDRAKHVPVADLASFANVNRIPVGKKDVSG